MDKENENLNEVDNSALHKTNVSGSYKVVSEERHNEVWASGFYDRQKAQNRIDEGYFHRFMYETDKHKKLIVIEE